MANETEGRNLDRELLTRGVSRLFQDETKGFYLVAVNEETVVGSLMITYEWSDWRAMDFYWIQSVYVRPEWRRHGVFRKMYEYV